MICKKIFSSVLFTAMGALSAFGWGQKGHDTVAFIAENHVTPATKAAIDSIYQGKSLVYYSNWLDNASHSDEYAYTKTWHYKNIDADETFRSAPLHPDGDVVRGILLQADILSSPETSLHEKALALKIISHLVGDIHQPMHMGHASDLGGNRWNVKFFKSPTNLHSVWDSKILEAGHKWSYTEWQQQIDRAGNEETISILTDAFPENWAEQTYVIATDIYNRTPINSDLSYDYISEWTPVIEMQLLKGGLRLADLLNTIFDPDYKGYWTPLAQ